MEANKIELVELFLFVATKVSLKSHRSADIDHVCCVQKNQW